MPQIAQPTHKLVKLFLLLFVLIVAAGGYLVFSPHRLPDDKPVTLVVSRGESLHKMATELDRQGVITSPRIFTSLLRLMGKDKKIVAGMYILNKPMSLFDLVTRLSNGRPDQISITILDGWTFKQIRAALASESQLTHQTIGWDDSQIRAALKINAPRLEGLLYPSTYFVAPGQSDLEVMHNAANLMQQQLTKLWPTRTAAAVYSNPYQLLIMASLIQKETSDESDMYQIATVFNNRIRSNMRLQDDPAVFYGLANRAVITRADFAIDTPYNTYLHAGLPPTPICTPSAAALAAAAAPLNNTKLLYFIAIGNGKSKFSTSYDEHLAAVSKYLKKKVK